MLPTLERTSVKGIPPTESFNEVGLSEEGPILSEIDRLSHSEEILTPIKVPIHFTEGTGYAGTFPLSSDQTLWPGPRGGAFIWLSSGSTEEQSGSYVQAKQIVKLHRLELQITEKLGMEEEVALYSCREASLQRVNPTLGFFKKLFSNPRRALIHPVSILSGLEAQKRSDLALMADFPIGVLGGRDPRPVIWNNLRGQAMEFDPKSLKSREAKDLLMGGNAVSREPIYDEVYGNNLMIQRTDGVGSDSRYSQYRIIALIPGMPRIATFMAPRSLSLKLFASYSAWIICSAEFNDRRLFYLINRQEGRLMAVYQSSMAGIKSLVRLRSALNETTLEMVALMADGSMRKYLFSRVLVEIAKFDGAAGLLTTFPVAEYETVADGPFDQVQTIKEGLVCRFGSSLMKMNEKFVIEKRISLSPQRLFDFSLFRMSRDGSNFCLAVIGSDPYLGRVALNIVDGGDFEVIAKIQLGMQQGEMAMVAPIYIPTRSI